MKKLLFAVILFFATYCIKSQGSWNILNFTYSANDKFGLFGESQIRSLKFYDHFHYYEYKGGFIYKADPHLTLAIAVGHYDTYKEGGNFVLPKNNSEFRIWPQVTLVQLFHRLKIEHRYRTECRFTSNGYRNRFRYRLGLMLDLGKEKKGYKPFQIGVNNELFFTNHEPFFERDRLWLSFNYRLSKQVYIQAGYIYQFDYKINDETGKDFIQFGLYIEIKNKRNGKVKS